MLNPPSHDVSIRDDAEKRCKITAFRRICQTFARFSCPFGKMWGVFLDTVLNTSTSSEKTFCRNSKQFLCVVAFRTVGAR